MIGIIDRLPWFLLPDAGPPRSPGFDSAGMEPIRPGKGERLLIVEDEYFVGLSLETDLMEAGYEIAAVVASGEEAIIEADRHPPPMLAILDIRLAGKLDGIETALKLVQRGIPVIFASAHSDQTIKERGALAQPLGWLTKPFSRNQLLLAVAGALDSIRGQ
jgi:two-component system, response regulator PdtaR